MKIIGANITGSFILNNQDVTNTIQSSSVWSGSVATQINSLNNATASLNSATASFSSATASLNAATASIYSATASLNTFTASAATTGSNTFNGNQIVSGSLTVTGSITTPGTLTAQTLVVQTITSSQDFVTGSTKFGSIISNTHQFTGSISVSGSVAVNDSNVILTNQTSSMSVATASFIANAQTASFVENAQTASFVTTAQTASFVTLAQTASFVANAQSASNAVNAQTASLAQTASYVENAQTASFVTTAQTASFVTTAQTASFVANAQSASFVTLAQTASFVTTAQTASFVTTAQTASFVTLAQTASFVTLAQTASFVANAQSASNAVVAQTASFANSFTVANTLTAQTLVVQTITSSIVYSSGSNIFGNNIANTQTFTGSVLVTGSITTVGRVYGTTTGLNSDFNSGGIISYSTGSTLKYTQMGYDQSGNYGWIQALEQGTAYRNLILNAAGGNIGIGTTNPGYKLDVNGDTQLRGDLIFNKGSRSTIYPATSGQNLHIKANGGGALQLMDDAAGNIQMVNGGGNVGIGTTSPSSILQVASTQSLVAVRSTTTTNYAEVQIENTTNYLQVGVEGGSGNRMGGTIAYNSYLGSYNNYGMTFHTNNQNRMTITNAGNVGIGSTNPATYRLEVNGGIYASSGFFGNATTATTPKSLYYTSGNYTSGTYGGTENADLTGYYIPYMTPIMFRFNISWVGNGGIQGNYIGFADAHYFNNGTATIIWTDDGINGGAGYPSVSVSVQGGSYNTRYLRFTLTAEASTRPLNWSWYVNYWYPTP